MTEPFVTIPEIHRAARARLPRNSYNFGAGGTETETTLRRNRRAIRRLAIRQDILVDVRHVDLTTSLLGIPLSWPVVIAPMGGLVLFHPEGDLEMARGAAKGDTLQFLSGATGWSVEAVAAGRARPQDVPALSHGRPRLGGRPARARGGVGLPLGLPHGRRPGLQPARARHRRALQPARGHGARRRTRARRIRTYPARLTWADVDWLRKTTRLPIGLKGVMTARDARRAVEAGVESIWVSNHGGRQLDATQAQHRRAARGRGGGGRTRPSIIVDGGFTRGTDVLKGVARGADAVAIGRTALWGLAADGAAGVACTLDILRRRAADLDGPRGQTSVRGLTPDVVFRVD